MKLGKLFSYIFAALGIVLMVFSTGLCLLSLDAPVRMLEIPDGAERCAEAFREAADNGNLTQMGALIYGQPDLGGETQPESPEGALVLEAFRDSFSCEFYGNYYTEATGIARDVKITTLDMAALMDGFARHAQTVLAEKVAAQESVEDICDENNNYRKEFLDKVLEEALQKALTQDVKLVTREVTLKLVSRDGSWWVVADQALLQAISGRA